MPGWSTDFRAGLRGPYGMGRNDLVFVIRTRPNIGGVRWMPYVTGTSQKWAVTSVAPELIPGLSETDIITPAYSGGLLTNYKETAQSVALRSWQAKLSSFTFEIADSEDGWGRNLVNRLPRGMIIEVDAGFPEFIWSEYQRVNIGTVRQVSISTGKIVITCDEVFSSLVGPGGLGALSFSKFTAFSGAGSTFNIAESVGNNENTIDVDDVTKTGNAACDLRGGFDHFVVQTTDTDDPTKTVYLRCDLSSSGSDNIYRSDAAVSWSGPYDWFMQTLGTTSSFPSGGVIATDTAAKLFYVVDDTFFETFMRIATSTGGYGTGDQNGDWDTLDARLGFGVPVELLWPVDMVGWHRQFENRAIDGSTFQWTPFFGSESENGWGEITRALKNLGIWAVMKEGMITLRSAISHCADIEGRGARYTTITDDGIESIKKHEVFHTNCRNEYAFFKFALGTGSTSHDAGIDDNFLETRPFSGAYEVSTVDGPKKHSGPVDPDVTTCWSWHDSDGSSGARSFVGKNSAWFTRIPEFAEIVTAGLRYAELAPGDIVTVTSAHLFGPEGMWTDRTAMVQSVHRDWMRGRVTLGLAALPGKSARFK